MSLSLSDSHDACVCLLFKFSCTDADAHICRTQCSDSLPLIFHWEIRQSHVVLLQIWANGETSPDDVCVGNLPSAGRAGACLWEISLKSVGLEGRRDRSSAHRLYKSVCYRITRTFVFVCVFVFSTLFERVSVCCCIRCRWWGHTDLTRFWYQWPGLSRTHSAAKLHRQTAARWAYLHTRAMKSVCECRCHFNYFSAQISAQSVSKPLHASSGFLQPDPTPDAAPSPARVLSESLPLQGQVQSSSQFTHTSSACSVLMPFLISFCFRCQILSPQTFLCRSVSDRTLLFSCL